jgi:hypothetical protein
MRSALKKLQNYLEPEIAKQFDACSGKIIRSGKETFAE